MQEHLLTVPHPDPREPEGSQASPAGATAEADPAAPCQ